jgi:translation initiation factor IF-2
MSIPNLTKLNKKLIKIIYSSFGVVSKNDLLEASIKYSEEQERIFNQMIVETEAKDKKAKREAFDKALYASYKGIGAMDFINTVLK